MQIADYASLSPTAGLQNDPKNLPAIGAMLTWNGKRWVPSGVGESVTVAMAATTAGGTSGSLTFTNGVLSGHTDPT